jgi:hypothetical protein
VSFESWLDWNLIRMKSLGVIQMQIYVFNSLCAIFVKYFEKC